MKKTLWSLFLACLLGFSSVVQAQSSLSLGFTSGWGGGMLKMGEGTGQDNLRIEPFLVIPVGLQARYTLNERWALQARAMVYWSTFNVRQSSPNVWVSGIAYFENTQGGLELSAMRRIALPAPDLFLAVEGGLSLQKSEIDRDWCASTAGGFVASAADTLFRTTRVNYQGEGAFLSGHLRLNLEYDFQIGRRPITIAAGLYANHALTPFWTAQAEGWEAIALETEAIRPFGDPNAAPIGFQPQWDCETEVMDAPDATNSWQNYGLSAGLQFSLLFHLSRKAKVDLP